MSIYTVLDGLFTIGSSHTTLPTSSEHLTHAHMVSEFMIGLEKMKAKSGEVSQSACALMVEDVYHLYHHCVGQDVSSKAEKHQGIVHYVSSIVLLCIGEDSQVKVLTSACPCYAWTR